ncbi:ABC transporter ATP-binding protein [Alpinimonas psychrophila]|uniref:Peptide/nickel transport system ATP-binding protein n=1 Tax=Alpinimonas psychrophila TaxID=748908 RepID=A0A7W3JS74_9MICO|nr:ABC transporter ATP-binding protein [Alpinimonas psychrophila]MBA8828172.1 peptide/nickel transport system ATP-binding protein [Alpinimonas psychrophila]
MSIATPTSAVTPGSGARSAITPLLEIRGLKVEFSTQRDSVTAVDGIDLTLMPGQTLAIVGESGSGKSTLAHSIINLLPGTGAITAGSILFDGQDLTTISEKELQGIRGRDIGFVPQDPMSNLNPVWSVGFQVEESVRANGVAVGRKEIRAKAIEVLRKAGLDDADARMRQFPHQFSGGMRQRVLIGMALSASPKLLIADEPTSALDVTVQRTILDYLDSLTRDSGTAVVLITHDLGLAAERAEQLVVMYRGKVVEAGPSLEILRNPLHPYTQRLVAAAPSLASRRLTAAAKGVESTLTSPVVAVPATAAAFDLAAIADRPRAGIAENTALQNNALADNAIVVDGLTKVYSIRGRGFKTVPFTAVDNVSFSIARGTTMALVGESGSGKSTVAKMLLGLEKLTSGRIEIDGADTGELSPKELFNLRRRMQPVFQDPYGSLDPLRNIENTIAEPLDTHRVGTKAERRKRVYELLDQVSLPRAIATRYPNELSGGQRQRVAVARALALKPAIVILDEAVSALDVLVQAQILQLLHELQTELSLTYLFITHDLAVVRVIADNVAVMNKGRIVEAATTSEVFENPKQEYTKRLLDAIPGANIRLGA